MNSILTIYYLTIAALFSLKLVLRKLNESICSDTCNKAETRCDAVSSHATRSTTRRLFELLKTLQTHLVLSAEPGGQLGIRNQTDSARPLSDAS